MELYQKQKKCLHIYRSINIYIKLGICWGSLLLTSCNNKSNYINSNEVISMAEKVDTVVYDMIQKVEELVHRSRFLGSYLPLSRCSFH